MTKSKALISIVVALLAITFTNCAVTVEEFKQVYKVSIDGTYPILNALDDDAISSIVEMDIFESRAYSLSAVDIPTYHYEEHFNIEEETKPVINQPLVMKAKYEYWDEEDVDASVFENDGNPTVRLEIMSWTDKQTAILYNENVKAEISEYMVRSNVLGINNKEVEEHYEELEIFGVEVDDSVDQNAQTTTQQQAEPEPTNVYSNLRGPPKYSNIYQQTLEITWGKIAVQSQIVYISVKVVRSFDEYLMLTSVEDIQAKYQLDTVNLQTLQMNILTQMINVMNVFGSNDLKIEYWNEYTFGLEILADKQYKVRVLSCLGFEDYTEYLEDLGISEGLSFSEQADNNRQMSEINAELNTQTFGAKDLITRFYTLNNIPVSGDELDQNEKNVAKIMDFKWKEDFKKINLRNQTTFRRMSMFKKEMGVNLNGSEKFNQNYEIQVRRIVI